LVVPQTPVCSGPAPHRPTLDYATTRPSHPSQAHRSEAVDKMYAAPPSEDVQKCMWNECGVQFDDAEALYEHITTSHIGRKSAGTLSLECQWQGCNSKATKRDHLTSHMRVHINLKPHKCTVSNKVGPPSRPAPEPAPESAADGPFYRHHLGRSAPSRSSGLKTSRSMRRFTPKNTMSITATRKRSLLPQTGSLVTARHSRPPPLRSHTRSLPRPPQRPRPSLPPGTMESLSLPTSHTGRPSRATGSTRR